MGAFALSCREDPSGSAFASAIAAAPDDAQVIAEFEKRVAAYVALHKKINSTLKQLPNDATPLQIDESQRKLSQGIVSARAGAKPGDIFHPEMQAYVRRALAKPFSGSDGKQVRSSILDENPIGTAVRINGPYPDGIPLASMPPLVLQALPKLPENIEYRFVGDRLILFDSHAHLIVDYVDRALPRL